ncbi:MAG: hypothetical protein ACK41Q_09635, partial [Candidatus Brocadia sp.]
VISPHDDTLSFCPYGLLHCMCIGTNFSTWIKHAEMVFSTAQVFHTSRHTILDFSVDEEFSAGSSLLLSKIKI